MRKSSSWGRARLYQYGYDFQSDSYVSRDLTVFADHILSQGGGIVGGAILRKPEARALFVLQNGTLALMTYNTLHEIHCWHRYETDGKILSVAALPNGSASDLLFLIVERENEQVCEQAGPRKSARYIELIQSESETYVDHDTRDRSQRPR